MIKFDIDGKQIEKQNSTPILVWCEGERSTTIGKFITKEKEYVLRVTKDGKLILN